MSPANLRVPFGESCCDGGECGNDLSAQPCGCDKGAGWTCERHRNEHDEILAGLAKDMDCSVGELLEYAMESVGAPRVRDIQTALDGEPSIRYVQGEPRSKAEVRVVDPKSGGEKGTKLARFDLLPPEALYALAEHYGRGAKKYADRNWEKGYKWGLTVAAMMRHLWQLILGERYDEETGTHHAICVAWHALALYTFDERKIGTDDLTLLEGTPK